MRKRLFAIAFIFAFFPVFLSRAQGVDYKTEFAGNWLKAEKIIASCQPQLQNMAAQFGVPYPEAIAVVFPELVRFSALSNKIEVALLKSLYVYKGEDYADFSVGIFQMKPSFAEKVRREALASGDKNLAVFFSSVSDTLPVTDFRKAILADMENPARQFGYLLAFYKLSENRYDLKFNGDLPEKVRFLASAYNCGFDRPEEYISEMERKKFFSLNLLHTGPFYPYSDIAAFYYNNSKF